MARKRAPADRGGIRRYAQWRKERGLEGGTRTAVEKALQSGRIKRGRDRLIHFAKADRDWLENTDHSRKTNGNGANPLTASRAREAEIRVALAELNLRRARGETVELEELRPKLVQAGLILRQRVLGIPKRLAGEMPRETASELDGELREALDDFADRLTKL